MENWRYDVMSENKKFISFFTWVTAIFLVLTYVFSIQEFSHPFMNNGFLETIFGGLFASFGVMLLAEIKKYWINKKTSEDIMYITLLNLYIELVMETKYADLYVNHPNVEVPSNVFSTRSPVIYNSVNTLRGIDYTPYIKNCILCCWNKYRSGEFPAFDKHINWCNNNLLIAINQEKMKALRSGKGAYNPIASDHDVNITIRKIKSDAMERIKAIELFITTLVSIYPDRYNWERDRKSVDEAQVCLPMDNPEINTFFKD